jgi:hypothetical protein
LKPRSPSRDDRVRHIRLMREWTPSPVHFDSGRGPSAIRRLLHPEAHAFYMKLIEDGYQPNVLIDVLPDERIPPPSADSSGSTEQRR